MFRLSSASILGPTLLLALPGLLQASPQDPWRVLIPAAVSAEGGASLSVAADGIIQAQGSAAESEVFHLDFELSSASLNALRLEVLADSTLPGGGPGRSANGNFVLSEVEILDETRGGMKGIRTAIVNPSATWSQQGYPISALADNNPASGWAIVPATGRSHTAYLPLENRLTHSASLRFRVDLYFHYGGAHSLGRFRLAGADLAEQPRVEEAEDWAQMQARIDAAIDRGVAYLIDTQEIDGSWSYHESAFPGGQTALSLYTLLKQKVSPNHPTVQRALAYMRAEMPNKTYTMGCLLLALASLEDPAFQPWMEELTAELVAWQHPGPEWQKGGFAYPDGGVDISNTQYGALGLWAAHKSGIEIPRKTWIDLARHMQLRQPIEGKAYEPVGFPYQPAGHISGSRTAAGLGIVAILERVLTPAELKGISLGAMRERALAWLAKYFSVKENPRCEGGDPWLYYYLYGLERVGSLLEVEHIGGSNWYREGARFLVDAQAANGCWTPGVGEEQANTCFAILFLSRATAASTGNVGARAQKTYGGDDPKQDVSLRASGDTPLNIWVSSFGEQAQSTWAWPVELGGGLRVSRVHFLLNDSPRAAAWWTTHPEWHFTQRTPGVGWQLPQFEPGSWNRGEGAFGDLGLNDASVNTEWSSPELWLLRSFEVKLDDVLEPELWVRHGDSAARQGLSSNAGPSVELLDETVGLAGLLIGSNPGSVAYEQSDAAHRGKLGLRVDGEQRYEPRIPGWGFAIRENPRAGEYRYLRFAWKSIVGDGLMLQFAEGGSFGPRTLRYLAGENVLQYLPCVAVAEHIPSDWTVVTRDLWKDFGGDALLSGMAFTPMGGSACFDTIYLGRTRADLPSLEDLEQAPELGADEKAAPPFLRLWLNGKEIYQGRTSAAQMQPMAIDQDLRELLVPGKNVLAAQVRAHGPGSFFDLELRDLPVLASVAGDPARPANEQRFATQLRFTEPGRYSLRARVAVHFQDSLNAEAQEDWLESLPLAVQIHEAFDPDLLAYGGDRVRNLLRGGAGVASASSEWHGFPAALALDGSCATGWMSAAADREPVLRVELARGQRARQLQLVPQRKRRVPDGQSGQAAKAEILINKKLAYSVDIVPGEWTKSSVRFEKLLVVRHIEIRFLREPLDPHAGSACVGLAELELLEDL